MRKKSKDILFIGALDLPNTPSAGDTVKNQFLLEYLSTYRSVDYIDTFYWRKKPTLLFCIICKALFGRYNAIVYSVSNVSAYKLARIFSILPIKSKLIYCMIGGYTPIKIASGEYSAKPFKKLDKIIVEADKVIELYDKVGIKNTLRVYNFKPFTYVPDISVSRKGEVKFFFLSRITEMKGAFLICDAVHSLNKSGYGKEFSIDFYGPISPEIKDRFTSIVDELPNVSYKGFLDLRDESNYSVLADYDAMLFPTMHLTEGFPGVIADAAIAGVPVIAADWNYADELLIRPQCGYVIQKGCVTELTDKMKYIVENRLKNNLLRANCIRQAQIYKMSNILTEKLLNEIGI